MDATQLRSLALQENKRMSGVWKRDLFIKIIKGYSKSKLLKTVNWTRV